MIVIAAPGTRCPMEGSPRKYITDSEAVDVPESAYYARLLTDGSLAVASGRKPQATRTDKKEVKSDGK